VKRFRGGPVFEAHRLLVSLNSRLRVIKKRSVHNKKSRTQEVSISASGRILAWEGGEEGGAGARGRTTSGRESSSGGRLVDFVYHSTPGLRVIKKKRRMGRVTCDVGRCRARAEQLKSFQEFDLKRKARILPWLACTVYPGLDLCVRVGPG